MAYKLCKITGAWLPTESVTDASLFIFSYVYIFLCFSVLYVWTGHEFIGEILNIDLLWLLAASITSIKDTVWVLEVSPRGPLGSTERLQLSASF